MKTLAFFKKKKVPIQIHGKRTPCPQPPALARSRAASLRGRQRSPNTPGVSPSSLPRVYVVTLEVEKRSSCSRITAGSRDVAVTHLNTPPRARGAGGILGNGPGRKPCKSPHSGSQRNEAKLTPALCLTFCGCYKRERI